MISQSVTFQQTLPLTKLTCVYLWKSVWQQCNWKINSVDLVAVDGSVEGCLFFILFLLRGQKPQGPRKIDRWKPVVVRASGGLQDLKIPL